ncbi:methyltransferase domain-containing protein [Saliterribacillus persicus]|uniref:Ubiquinone/menaquinone biosynthesis C-methylase UbiE n=1 Tax=Saliterribacillus persicus TaxID=930114 RepID=A0A368X957_9BACI|nr:methyltransferase domain-containing protein [Saliterribacillus persicus]RCW62574.1 ubiquinone/menaquinone biosynthesis C-methylase UbiE [Saliterribacillus persicus]
MKEDIARERAKLTDSKVIDVRTLQNSHKRLSEIITEGFTILDVGCGTGAINSGMAEAVGEKGKVFGVDNNPEFIEAANEKYKDVSHLTFEEADIYHLPFENTFDVVTSARVLQWLEQPEQALKNMVKATKKGGKVIVLDYNHEKILWEPEIPNSMKVFYDAFLKWRQDAGMDNKIADNLSSMFKKAGLDDVLVTDQSEKTQVNDSDFQKYISLWKTVAMTRGQVMVEEGYIKEKDRQTAITEFDYWIKNDAISQTMYLLAVEGTKK